MADNLISSDYLLVEVSALFANPIALRRVSPKRHKMFGYGKRAIESMDDWAGNAYREYYAKAKEHLTLEARVSKGHREPVRMPVENSITGNFAVWDALKALIKYTKGDNIKKCPLFKTSVSKTIYAIDSGITRAGPTTTPRERKSLKDEMLDLVEPAAKLRTVKEIIYSIYGQRISETNKFWKESRFDELSDTFQSYVKFNSYAKHHKIDLRVVNATVAMTVSGKRFVMSQVHYHRLMRMLDTLQILLLASNDMGLKIKGEDLPEFILETIWKLVEDDVDYLGEALKGVRGYLIAKLDEDGIGLGRPADDFMMALTPYRRSWVRNIASPILSVTRSIEDAINLTNFYRGIPHPDSNIADVFETIKGVKKPNTCKPSVLPRFRGNLRRSLYKSMTAQGHEVRLVAQGEAGEALDAMSRSTRIQTSEMLKQGFLAWDSVVFERVRGYGDLKDMGVPSSSKASQKNEVFTEEDLQASEEYATGIGDHTHEVLSKWRTINDATEELKGRSELEGGPAIDRFEKVVRLHEAFEAEYPDTLPEDIPSQDMHAFLMKTPEARYLVGTEPKFGEVHKKVTRMFYIAEQQLKAVTQRVERVAKQVGRRQSGVSIVKSYSGRRKDLESMCYSMTSNTLGKKSVFVSFDMSEFSKKFPMALVREYGKIMAEITGEDWMARLDVIFRASIVIHSSRGFFGFISGVKGGFEGFFNFVWSTIHAIIMEISLEALGVQGELLTFSDDGLLLFYVDINASPGDIMALIEKIQQIYAAFGLVFHLGKTLISHILWEYLGDVCFENHLLPMWVKELSSVGSISATKGLEPFYMRIRAIEAQTEAVVTAGGNPLISYIIRRLLSSYLLERVHKGVPPSVEEVLFILPSSAGGLRIKSPYESTVLSTIERDAEIVADLEFLGRGDPVLLQSTLAELRFAIKGGKNLLSSVLSATRFVTSHPDTSGMGVLSDAVEIARRNAPRGVKLARNPIQGELGERVSAVLEGIDNIHLDAVSSLIYATPEWNEYNASLALVKGSGAIRIIKRSDLKQLQSTDTKRVSRSIQMWKEALDMRHGGRKQISEILQLGEERVFPNCSLAPLRPSPRTALTRIQIPANASLEVRINTTEARSLNSAAYREPAVRFPQDITTIAWASERGGDVSSRNLRRFFDSVARFLSAFPDSERVVQVLASSVGVDLPIIPRGIKRGSHRRVGGSGNPTDIRVNLPRLYDSTSTARYLGGVATRVYTMQRGDRGTYLEAARALSYYAWRSTIRRNRDIEENIHLHYYTISEREFDLMHRTIEMTDNDSIPPRWPVNPIDEKLSSEYRSSFMEYQQYREHAKTLDETSRTDTILTDTEKKMMIEVSIASYTKWICEVIRDAGNILHTSMTVPGGGVMQRYVLGKAVVRAGWKMMNPRLRRRLGDNILKYVKQVNTESEDLELLVSAEYKEFETHVYRAIGIVIEANMVGHSRIDLSELVNDGEQMVRNILEIIEDSTLTKKGRIVVIRGAKYTPGKFTPSHRAAYKEAFTNTLSHIYATCRELDWNADIIAERLKFRMNIDDVIDCLVVGRACIRESEHRGIDHPYNATTFRIQLFKLYSFISYIVKHSNTMPTQSSIAELARKWELPGAMKGILMEGVKGTRPGQHVGADHIAMINTGIEEVYIHRCMQHLRSYFKNGKKKKEGRRGLGSYGDRTYSVLYTEMVGQATAFYETIVRNASKSLVEYPIALERKIIEEFTPSTVCQAEVMSISANSDQLSGSLYDISALRGRAADSVTRLLNEHISDYVRRNNLIGMDNPVSAPQVLVRALTDYYSEGAGTLGYLGHRSSHDSNFKAVIIGSSTAEGALSNYAILASTEGSSVSVFRDSVSGRYIVAGIVSEIVGRVEPGEGDGVSIPEGKKAEEFISTLSVEDQIDMLARGRRASERLRSDPASDIHRASYVGTFIRAVGAGIQVNENSAMLQAAYDCARENPSEANKLGIYAAVTLWGLGMENPQLIPGTANRIKGLLNEPTTAVATSQDIAMTLMWLTYSYVTPGIEIAFADVNLVRSKIKSVKTTFEFPISATTQSFNSLTDAKLNISTRGGQEALGRLSSSLFRRIPQTSLVQDTEEEDEPDDSSVELELDALFG